MIALLYGLALGLLTAANLYRFNLIWRYYRHAGRGSKNSPRVETFPRVTVQLPVYNERFVVERLVRAAAALEYPRDLLEIQVLDDSTDDTTSLVEGVVQELRERGCRIHHLRRAHRQDYKAGALAAGMEIASGELLAIFDADFVPPPDFLVRSVAPFNDPNIGMVQAKWGFLNQDESVLTRVQSIFLNGHFVLEHGARFRSGHFFNFNGTAGIWRKKAILDSGGWSGDTLTEDLDLSYRAQLQGWKFLYLEDLEVPSELPSDLSAVKTQQFRWVKGMVQVARKLLPYIWRSRFPWATKLDATFHLLSCSGYVTTTLVALLLVPYFILAPEQATSWTWVAVVSLCLNFVGVLAYFTIAELENHSFSLRRLWDLLCLIPVGVGLSLNGVRAVMAGLRGRATPFERTPKHGAVGGRRAPLVSRYTNSQSPCWGVECVFAGYYLAAVAWIPELRNAVAFPAAVVLGSGYCFVAISSTLSLLSASGDSRAS